MTGLETGNTTEALAARVFERLAPPPVLLPDEFADRDIMVTSGPLAGTRWSTDFAPYQRGIMRVFHEPGIQIAAVMGSSQWGKTAVAVNLVAYHIAHDPCSILVVEPTVEPMAKDFAKNRMDPVIAASPRLRDVVSRKRSRDSSNTTLSKSFHGGALNIGGANSAASLASRAVRFLVLDEPDRYPVELPGEGNTIAIAMKRTTSFRHRRRILLLSSPTLEDGPIHHWFKQGDQRRFYVPCPSCRHMHPFEWKQVVWENRDPSTAHLQCPACRYRISEAERVAILGAGEWRAENPDRPDKTIASFHLWEAYSPLSSLAEIVAAFLRAREAQKAGDKSVMHTWENTTLGEPRPREEGIKLETEQVLERRAPFVAEGIDVPDGACCLVMGVDSQDDRLEALVAAYGVGEECWYIDRHTWPGDPDGPEPWRMLDQVLGQAYRHASGQELWIQATCIDSAGHRTTAVYENVFKRQARRVYAVIGRAGDRPFTSSPSPRRWGRDERQVPLYTIGVDTGKALIHDRLALEDDVGPGRIHLPEASWCDEEFVAQLTAEKRVRVWKKGVPVVIWRRLRARNEMLDCALYGLAALRILNPRLSSWLQALRQQAAMPATAPPAPPRPPGRRVSRSQYLGGGG